MGEGHADLTISHLPAIEELEKERDPTPARETGIQNLKRLRTEASHLSKELQSLADIDPVVIAKKEAQIKVRPLHESLMSWAAHRVPIQVAKEAANRWTDNVFAARQWCLDKMGGSTTEEQFNQQMGIPQDLDFID